MALNLGAEDFALSVGMLPEAEGLFYPKQQLIIAARAAGVMPLGFIGTVADFKDLDAFRATIQRSRRMGFMGASVIHPSQIAILNEEFRPTAEEVALARRIVAAYEKSTAEGVGAIVLDGKMIESRSWCAPSRLWRARPASPPASSAQRPPRPPDRAVAAASAASSSVMRARERAS
ncbi:MAG: aldolase/citrate lyase family protein [Pseudomonadota bacterium]